MKLATLVSASSLVALVLGDYGAPAPKCDVITTTKGAYECPDSPRDCTVLQCLTQVPVTLRCGCSTISTVSTCPTACPTGCGGTQYITAVEDCFPTSTRYTNSTTLSSTLPGHDTTVTACPKDKYCPGPSTTLSSTLPGYDTTVTVCPKDRNCPGPSTSTAHPTTKAPTSPPTTTPPPTTSKPTSSPTSKPTTTQLETNAASGRGLGGATFALVGAVFLAAAGLL